MCANEILDIHTNVHKCDSVTEKYDYDMQYDVVGDPPAQSIHLNCSSPEGISHSLYPCRSILLMIPINYDNTQCTISLM